MRLLIILTMIVAMACVVLAATGEDAEVTLGSSGQITESPLLPGDVTAQGGNVTRVDLKSNITTTKWQGFYGNVSGNVVLGLGVNALYDFGSSLVTAVYAAQDASFDWANLDDTTSAQVDTAFGFTTAGDVDQAVDIFSETIDIEGSAIRPATTLEDGNFMSYLVDDGNNAVPGDFAFGAEVQNTPATGFDGSNLQYELLVPVQSATPTYYFFMTI